MEQNLTRTFTLFGGLALFLYGMDALSHSLETAAGSRLKSLLAAVTGSPVRGVLAGAAVTAVLQSSSAVTVMVLGFVSAGLLTLRQAVPVIFGCNIGTTVTAQLLAFRLEDMRGLVLLAGLLLCFACAGRRPGPLAGRCSPLACCSRALPIWALLWNRWRKARRLCTGWVGCGSTHGWGCWRGLA